MEPIGCPWPSSASRMAEPKVRGHRQVFFGTVMADNAWAGRWRERGQTAPRAFVAARGAVDEEPQTFEETAAGVEVRRAPLVSLAPRSSAQSEEE
jgi:hypothetical protein